MQHHCKIMVVLFGIAISGCVSIKHQPMSANDKQSLQGGTITNSVYETPPFSAMTAGKASFALIGAVAMLSEGNRIIRENNVPDPAIQIGQKLNELLAVKHSMSVVNDGNKITPSRNLPDLTKTYSDSDFIMDIKTINWSFAYFPTDWNSYRVIYTARMRLIDTKDKNIIAEEFCKRIPEYEDTNTAPSHDYLIENNAAGLKAELLDAVNYCTDYFKDTALNM